MIVRLRRFIVCSNDLDGCVRGVAQLDVDVAPGEVTVADVDGSTVRAFLTAEKDSRFILSFLITT